SKASARLGRGEVRHVPKHEQTRIYVDRAIDFVRRNRDQPFYLRLFPNDVHDGHHPAPGAAEKFADVTDDPAWQRFFAVLVEMDRQLGRLIEEIDRLGLAEDTLIVLTSDNGPTDWPHYYRDPNRAHPPGFTGPFFARKWSLYEGGIRMPFIARWKDRVPAGVTNDESIVAGIDLLPTFCALARVPVPEKHDLDGVEMSAALLGKPVQRPKPVFWQYGGVFSHLRPGKKAYVSPSLAMRDGRWKLLMNPDGSDTQLCDLGQDPGETTNLAEKHPQVVERMKPQLLAWYREVGYPERLEAGLADADLVLTLAGRKRPLTNHGAEIRKDKARPLLTFDGDGYLDLPREHAPSVARRRIAVSAEIHAHAEDGVILAHGGDRTGYALHLAGGRPAFSVCVDWKRATIAAAEPLGEGWHSVAAELGPKGSMSLSVDGKVVAQGRAAGLLLRDPGDTLQIGADTVKPVGGYRCPHPFQGQIRAIRLDVR
ncbi:MAG: sulfatase-like hydrolase/transferase, partial [Planctomycetota bacterium]